jgi:6-phosphogluconolactonase
VHAYPPGYSGGGGLGRADFWGSECAVTPDGRFLYYVCRVHQSLACFAVDVARGGEDGGKAGALKPMEVARCALHSGSNARNLTIMQAAMKEEEKAEVVVEGDVTDCTLVLVASQDAGLLEVFRVLNEDGQLARIAAAPAACVTDVAVL